MEKDCYNYIKKDVCKDFIENKVRNGKFIGCKKWFTSEIKPGGKE